MVTSPCLSCLASDNDLQHRAALPPLPPPRSAIVRTKISSCPSAQSPRGLRLFGPASGLRRGLLGHGTRCHREARKLPLRSQKRKLEYVSERRPWQEVFRTRISVTPLVGSVRYGGVFRSPGGYLTKVGHAMSSCIHRSVAGLNYCTPPSPLATPSCTR